jgi:hypothetical protein
VEQPRQRLRRFVALPMGNDARLRLIVATGFLVTKGYVESPILFNRLELPQFDAWLNSKHNRQSMLLEPPYGKSRWLDKWRE